MTTSRTQTFQLADFTDEKRTGKGATAELMVGVVNGKNREAIEAIEKLGFSSPTPEKDSSSRSSPEKIRRSTRSRASS